MPVCGKCNKKFKGFGDACTECRKAPSSGAQKACKKCGDFFSGFGDECTDCWKNTGAKGASHLPSFAGEGGGGGGSAKTSPRGGAGAGKAAGGGGKKGAAPAKGAGPPGGKKWDNDGVAVEDSNMALVGSAEDKAARKKAAGTEVAWKGVGMEPGLWIWRIEQFKVVPWPKKKYGQFHEGDSYICLYANFGHDETGKETEKIERDIHFWLGRKTSTDEKGAAAYKTVELDDFFDGEPVQHREVQGIESDLFLSHFEKELKYLPGGVESGFKVTQTDVFTNKLYQVRRNAKKKIVIEEENVERKSLNHRDAFILDTGRKIYVWFGDEASAFVKQAANAKAETWEQERNGESTVETNIDDAFWAALGGKGKITAAKDVGEEVEADFGEGILFSVQVDDKTRELKIEEVGRKDIHRSMLDPTAVMMLDTRSEIFMWIGSKASAAEGRIAMSTAVNYLKMNKRNPDTTAIHILKEGKGENNKVWKQTFSD